MNWPWNFELWTVLFIEKWRSGQSEYLRIKEEINKVVTKGKAAGVLRLVFHDAGTFEMDENSGTKIWKFYLVVGILKDLSLGLFCMIMFVC